MRRCWPSGGERPPSLTLSQQGGGAEGSLVRVMPGRVGAALTTSGRASTARWRGSGKRGGEEYERNRRRYVLTSSPAQIWRIWVGCGAHGRYCVAGTSGASYSLRPGGYEECLRRTHGDAAGIQPGSSFIERITVNTGTGYFGSRSVGLQPTSRDRHIDCRTGWPGRSRRSTPSRGKPGTWGRAAAV